jgi:cell division protein FtsQ
MNPQNRRISRPNLPPDVLDLAACCGDEPEALAPSHEFARPLPKRPTRLGVMVRAVAGGALVVAISLAVAWGARRHITTSPRFAVSDIVVSGQKHRSADFVAGESGLSKGQNIFTADLDRARARLLADPWISEANLARRLPGTVFLRVTEREAGAIVALGDSYLASREGELFKRVELGDPTDLPIITGLNLDSVSDDRAGIERTIQRAIDLAGEYDRGPLAQRAPLEEIHFDGDGGVSLIVGRDAMSLHLGAPPFRRKLDEAARVIAELDHRGAKADAIMLDNEARPERVVVRMR